MPVSGGDPLMRVIMVAISLRWCVAWLTTCWRSAPSATENRAREVGLGEAVHEGALLGLEGVPLRAQIGERREVRVAGEARQRAALPAREPDGVGAVDVREHPLYRGDAPVLAHVPRDGVAEIRRDLEEPPVRPTVIVVKTPGQLHFHLEPPIPGRRPCPPPGPSAPRRP